MMANSTSPDVHDTAALKPRGGNRMQLGATEKADTVFYAAQRHSTRVRVLKTALPVAAVLIAVVFSWFTFFATPPATVKVLLGDGAEDGKLVMTSPNLNGFTKDNLPYKMTATKATQDAKQSGVIALEGISAELPVGTRGRATIAAQSGIYDNVNQRLQLNKEFTVTTDDGLHAKLQSADVNIASGQITTDKPVDIRSGNTHISANRMQVQDKGSVLRFEDHVTLEIDPGNAPGDETVKSGQND